ncbi:hypothetical protein LEP3755_03880 [Leptolyngbya sp. NIES-3755]|nr:hypothetical protein LEP3755_03880 [Leptolyngbya sp. NIES-3755]
MSDRDDSEYPELPDRWQDIEAQQVYRSKEGRFVSFIDDSSV